MEGISHEAIDLAGHLKLNKLIVFWDDNGISIDGNTQLATSTNQIERFKSCGWEVFAVDGHDFEEIENTINLARKSKYPSLIACKTKIGFGSPNFQGTSKVHGAPLGENEIKLTRTNLNWEYPPFSYPNKACLLYTSPSPRDRG